MSTAAISVQDSNIHIISYKSKALIFSNGTSSSKKLTIELKYWANGRYHQAHTIEHVNPSNDTILKTWDMGELL